MKTDIVEDRMDSHIYTDIFDFYPGGINKQGLGNDQSDDERLKCRKVAKYDLPNSWYLKMLKYNTY